MYAYNLSKLVFIKGTNLTLLVVVVNLTPFPDILQETIFAPFFSHILKVTPAPSSSLFFHVNNMIAHMVFDMYQGVGPLFIINARRRHKGA